MPDPKYHPTSYGFAAQAVAEDLDRIAAELRSATTFAMAYGAESAIIHAAERLELQAAAMREIAIKSYRDEWPTHVEVPSLDRQLATADSEPDQEYEHPPFAAMMGIPDPRTGESARLITSSIDPDDDYPPIDPDAEGPSWDDPEGYRQPPWKAPRT